MGKLTAPVPKWLKYRKQRVCCKCGGNALTDIARRRATFWCSACHQLWTVYRNVHGDITVRYFQQEEE